MRRGKRIKSLLGFTLVELMIVVVIIGILAAVAIPTFQKFMTKSKEGEAAINIAAIAKGARVEFLANDKRYFHTSRGRWYRMPSQTPVALCSSLGHNKYTANTAQWDVAPWRELGFKMTAAHYFQYGWYTSGLGRSAYYSIQATTDMDCDGTTSLRTVVGKIDQSSGEVVEGGIQVTRAGE